VDAAAGQTSLAARHARARGHLRAETFRDRGPGPAGATANLLVRRQTWEDLAGFAEVRSGADLEFCWRAAESGWSLGYRPEAHVEHLHAETVAAMGRKARRYGPGQAWVNRRFPGSAPRPQLFRQLARAAAGVLVWAVAAQFERAAFKALDGAWIAAYARGYYFDDNEPLSIDGASTREPTPD
jgi:cellulose synthase/poly-beta-1,6-N-acetylglucosamine synthase-like glycosyltransferase